MLFTPSLLEAVLDAERGRVTELMTSLRYWTSSPAASLTLWRHPLRYWMSSGFEFMTSVRYHMSCLCTRVVSFQLTHSYTLRFTVYVFRTIIFCGEVVTTGLLVRCIEALPQTRFINLYSISEAHDVACCDLTAWYKDNKVRMHSPTLTAFHHEVINMWQTMAIFITLLCYCALWSCVSFRNWIAVVIYVHRIQGRAPFMYCDSLLISECPFLLYTNSFIDEPWWCNAFMTQEQVSDKKFCPVGKLLPGVHVVILDANLKPQPLGVPGEVGSLTLTHWYNYA